MKTSQIRLVVNRPSDNLLGNPPTPTASHRVITTDHSALSGPSGEELRLYGPLGKSVPLPQVNAARFNPDPRLLDEFTPARVLAEGVMPIRKIGRAHV